MGGAGLAWPPLHCSFTKPLISFAIFFDLLVQTTFHSPRRTTGSSKFLKTAGAVVKEQIGGAKIDGRGDPSKEIRLFL
jgi:hypothetical protein